TDKSRVVGDLRVYAFEDRFVLDMEGRQAAPLLAYIQKFLVSDDVVLEDLGPSGHLEVHGPAATRIVSAVAGVDVRGLLPDRGTAFAVERRRAGHVARVGGVGEVGFALWAEGADLAASWARFLEKGVTPVGRDAFDVLRIEAGMPRVGVDMGEDTLALEVAPADAISFSKGCYVGQEVVARGTYRGHMNRRLMGLQVDGDVPPERGNRVRTAHGDVGHVSSGAWSPTLGRVIALALLRIEEVGPATDLFVDRGGWDLRASLHSLPFVRGGA
ncbi:MAG: CAF17-like 4Fe-4S cluster assembly/insertion protein YgfZ, partial [Methanobacteriota archaeon]